MISVVHVVGKMNRGGLETFIMNVLRNINTREFHCDILCTLPGAGDYDSEAAECGAILYNIGDAFQAHSGKMRFLFQFRDYVTWFKQHKYDVVHVHGSHAFDNSIAIMGALKAGCQMVISHSHTNDGGHKAINALSAQYLQKADIVRLACSHQAGKWLYGNDNCFEIIKNGIDVERFAYSSSDRREIRASLGISGDEKVIMSTGRLVDVKNQSFLLYILNTLLEVDQRGWSLFLVGEGENETALRDEARRLGVEGNVYFLGLRNDVHRLLSASDVFVMTSLHEGLPLAAVEAQANGLLTYISSGTSPETKLLSSTSILNLDDGPKLWAREIRSALKSASRENAAIQATAHVKALGFDIAQTVTRLECIYSSVGKA